MKRRLAVTSTRQPDDPLLHVLAEVDVRLVHLQVDPGEDVDQALHLLPVRLAGHGLSHLRNGFSVVDSSALPPMNFEINGWILGMIAVWNQGDSKNRRRRAGSISLSFAAQSGFQASIASMTGPRMPSTMTP